MHAAFETRSGCERTMALQDVVDASERLERVDVLREAHAQQLAVVQDAHEGVGWGGPVSAWEELFRERVD